MNNLRFDKDFIKQSKNRIINNRTIANYYRQKSLYENDDVLFNRAKKMELCLKYWDVDYFRFQAVKDVKRVNLCQDLFCKNCQHNLALKRFSKYSPVLEDLSKNYNLYHITFTVPNTSGIMLKSTIDKMYSKFVYINRYFNSDKKSRTFDFTQFGFVGAVRSLEITFDTKNNEISYHPHFHCIFVFKNDLDLKKINYNKFSFSNKSEDVKAFSNFEIFLQKMWYLLYNDIRFNAKNFNDLKMGYSCSADKCKVGQYHEVFKYALGGVFKKGFELDYDVFSYLLNALYRRKIIQGYGILNRFKFDLENDNEIIYEYFAFRQSLEEFEKPVREVVDLQRVEVELDNGISYISKFKKAWDDGKIKDSRNIIESSKKLKTVENDFVTGVEYLYKTKKVSCIVVILRKNYINALCRIARINYDTSESEYYKYLKDNQRKFFVKYENLQKL